jgi:hypothetical protein
LIALGLIWETRRTSRQNEVLPKNLEADVRSKVAQRTYGIKPKRMVRNMTGDFILISCLKAPVFLFYGCFSRVRTNRMFFINLENPDHLEFLEMLYDLGEF